MFFFRADYWVIVIILTLIAAFTLDKKKINDARYKSGYREVVDNTKGFRTRLREGFIGALILTTIGYVLYYIFKD